MPPSASGEDGLADGVVGIGAGLEGGVYLRHDLSPRRASPWSLPGVVVPVARPNTSRTVVVMFVFGFGEKRLICRRCRGDGADLPRNRSA